MPKFKIVVEVGSISVLSKVFDADSEEEAIALAEAESWEADGWEEIDTSGFSSVREELCEKMMDDKTV
jgi:hypothetical protein